MEITIQNIERKIFTVRNVQVMLDNDLAKLYETETKFINRAIARNPQRFPDDFAFQLNEEEWNTLRFQIGTLKINSGRGHHRKYRPMPCITKVVNYEIRLRFRFIPIELMD